MPPASLLWLLVATALWLLVLLGVDSDGLLLVGGSTALLLALLLTVLPLPAGVQAVLFLVLVAVSYSLVRRWLSQGGRGAALMPSARAEEAEVIDGFAADGRGRVRWQGQSWAARSLDATTLLSAGQRVTVMGREGNCLQVMAQRPMTQGPMAQRPMTQGPMTQGPIHQESNPPPEPGESGETAD